MKEIWVGNVPYRKSKCLMLAEDNEPVRIVAYFRNDEAAQEFLDFADGLSLKRGAAT